MLDPRPHESIARFRGILEANGYLDKAAEMLGSSLGGAHLRADLPLYLRRVAAPEPLNILMRLFAFYVPVSEEHARIAFAPMTLDEVAALGLVERGPGGVRGLVSLMIMGSIVVACDRLEEPRAEPRPDFVLGLNPPAVTLANLTVRRPVRKALDLGCGGGIQGLLAAAHAEHLVAVDLNPRALAFTRFNSRLNGLAEPDCREGSFFAPVAGERFGLIACNPPYAISPDSRYLFRDGGREGDAVCEEIVRGAAAHLEEDGYATVLCNWALREGEDVSAPPRRWVDSYGCDAWILTTDVEDPLTYAAGWSRVAGDSIPPWTGGSPMTASAASLASAWAPSSFAAAREDRTGSARTSCPGAPRVLAAPRSRGSSRPRTDWLTLRPTEHFSARFSGSPKTTTCFRPSNAVRVAMR